MGVCDNREFEIYKAEAKETWGMTDAYKEYTDKMKHYSKAEWNTLVVEMDDIFALFAACMKKDKTPDSSETQELVKNLQSYITKHCYMCTNEILAGLGQIYVADERFKNNIDKHAGGTAAFVSQAIEAYCRK